MQLEDSFDFLAPNDIRIKGTRVGIESILYEYIHRKLSLFDSVLVRLGLEVPGS